MWIEDWIYYWRFVIADCLPRPDLQKIVNAPIVECIKNTLYFYHNKKNISKKRINRQSLAQAAGRTAPRPGPSLSLGRLGQVRAGNNRKSQIL